MTAAPSELDVAKAIATPSRLGLHVSRKMWGEKFYADPWMLEIERNLIPNINLVEMTNDDDDEDADDALPRHFYRIHLPPQVGKTRYMVLTAFWVLGMNPGTRIIFVAYSDTYAAERGREVRNLVKAFGKQLFGIEVDPDNDSQSDWGLKDHRGGMLSVGVGSQITGRSGDLIIVDDLIKNAQEAASPATKGLHEREWNSSIYTRLQPGGVAIVTNTRWAEDDLAGRLEEKENDDEYTGERFTVLNFPAIAEIPADERVDLTDEEQAAWRDIIGRLEGEPLKCRYWRGKSTWEESIFYRIKASTVQLTWACLYQQDPRQAVGGMFPPNKWQRYKRDELPRIVERVRAWDLAASAGTGDWTVGTLIGRGRYDDDETDYYFVLDVIRKQLDADDVLTLVKDTAVLDGYGTKVLIEQGKSGDGKSVVAFYASAMPQYTVEGAQADGVKEVRAKPYSTLMQLGQVKLPADGEVNSDWVKGYIVEHRAMLGDGRRGRHDDQIDTAAYCILDMISGGPAEILDMSGANFDAEAQLQAILERQALTVN